MLGKNLLTLIIEQEDARDKRLAADKTDPIQTLPLVPLAQLKSVCRDVLRGLDFLHTTCGLVHTDIKPENLSLALYDGHDEFFADSAAKPAADNDTAAVSGAAEKLDDKPKTIKPDNIKMEDTKPAKPPAATTAAAKDIKTASVEKNGFCVENEVFCDGAAAGVGGGWGRVKILDLGNSVALGEVDDSEIATVQYRAPEIILVLSEFFGPFGRVFGFCRFMMLCSSFGFFCF